MPFYSHLCEDCGHAEEIYLKIADRDQRVGSECPVEDCDGHLIRVPELPGFTSSESLGRVKAPKEFRDLLKAIKKENPGSTINER